MKYDLVYLDKTVKFLTKFATIDEALEIRNKAKAIQAYSKQKEDGEEIQRQCGVIILRAGRRIGDLLPNEKEAQSEGGRRSAETRRKRSLSDEKASVPTKRLTNRESQSRSRMRKIAGIPNAIFEQYLEDCEDSGTTPTEAGCQRYHSSIAHQEELEKKRRRKQPWDERFPNLSKTIQSLGNFRSMIDDSVLPKWASLKREFLAEDQDPESVIRFLSYCTRAKEAITQVEQKVLALQVKRKNKRFRIVK